MKIGFLMHTTTITKMFFQNLNNNLQINTILILIILFRITSNDFLFRISCKTSLFSSNVRHINTTKINKMRFNLNRRIRYMISHISNSINYFSINVKKHITRTKMNIIRITR